MHWNAELFLKYDSQLREMFLYGIIGGFSSCVDMLVFMVLCNAGMHMAVANFISVNVGMGFSFVLNTYVNFKKTDRMSKRAACFFMVGYSGLVLSMLIIWFGMRVLGMEKMLVKIVSIVIVATVQYLLHKWVTFRDNAKHQ